MNRKVKGLCIGLSLVLCSYAFSYDVILKNGKTIKGTLITETEEMVVLEDASGIRLNLKKTTIDAEKTAAANAAKPAAEAPPPPAPVPEKKAVTPAAPKKKVRAFTEADIERLREKYDLGSGTYGERKVNEDSAPAEESSEPFGRSEEEWRATSQELKGNLAEAEKAYQQLAQNCERLKGITVQTHILTEKETGQPLDMVKTREEVCEDAEQWKAIFEQAQQDYQKFLEEARQEGVPPGWTER